MNKLLAIAILVCWALSAAIYATTPVVPDVPIDWDPSRYPVIYNYAETTIPVGVTIAATTDPELTVWCQAR
jgi:hypothetical protein